MNRKVLVILGVIGLAAIAIGVLMVPKTSEKKKVSKKEIREEFPHFASDKGYSDSIYPDAPLPHTEDASLEDEAVNLWPTAIKSVKDDAHREKVREQWKDFAARYPKNVYLLNEYKPAMTQKEEAEIRANLDSVTNTDAFFARNMAMAKYSGEPGKNPVVPKDPSVTPAEQRTFFEYKIRELESRIELIEYARENKVFSSDQEPNAQKEIASLKKELEKLKEVSKTVPNS